MPRRGAGVRVKSWKKSLARKFRTPPVAAWNAASPWPSWTASNPWPISSGPGPRKSTAPLIEGALTLDFLTRGRNLILCGTAGLGKTMIAKNIAHTAILAGHTALFRTASDLLADVDGDSPGLRRRKFRFYARPNLLVIDECGYLSYDAHAADLLFEIVNHRYERNSIVLTTNKGFKEWNTVFPNATCIAALLDRLTHHAEVTLIEGDSYRMRESQMEAEATKKNSKRDSHAQRS